MEITQQVIGFIESLTKDDRLNPVQTALLIALCNSWISSGFEKSFNTSRRTLMKSSHIRSRATYHKTLKQLIEMKYLDYRPSYHPINGSTVSLNINVNKYGS